MRSAGEAPEAKAAWLDRAVKPALATARKGGLVSAQEQLDFLAELADLSPEYAVGSVILEMLQVRERRRPDPVRRRSSALGVTLTKIESPLVGSPAMRR
jgi:hypothetical protein